MNDLDLAYTPVWQLRKLMDSHQVSSVELTEMYLRRIAALNPRLNAYLTVTAEEALESARSADKLISQIVSLSGTDKDCQFLSVCDNF